MYAKKKVIVFEHVKNENLEILEEILLENNFIITKIKLYLNEKIPKDLFNFNLMIVLGGPMDTWMIDEYPWLNEEKLAIKKFAIELKKPFLGLCLGCQLLGEALGQTINKSKKQEVGFLNISTTPLMKNDKNFPTLPKKFKVFQWHSYEVSSFSNPDVDVLAFSNITESQIFRFCKHAYGIQFHFELKSDTIEKWSENVSLKYQIEELYGLGSIHTIAKIFEKELKTMNQICIQFMKNFLKNIELIKSK